MSGQPLRRRLFTIAAMLTLVSATVAGQKLASGTSPVQPASSKLPRTPWGHPDLQGTWTNATTTPLERPAELAGKSTLTEAERRERDARAGIRDDRALSPGDTGFYNDFWLEQGRLISQTSLIVDPPDGRLPPLTPVALAHKKSLSARRIEDGGAPPASHEDFDAYDRCISRALPGAMMPGFYNHNYQILQTPDYVAILVEMIHDVRIIPLDGRSRVSRAIPQWFGDSRGRWEGNTLVVETTNFRDDVQEVSMGNTVVGGSPDMLLVERFTRVDANTIDYRFTVNDPAIFTAPWTVSAPMTTAPGRIFEYACHEGNYALSNMLRGARAKEERAPGNPSSPASNR